MILQRATRTALKTVFKPILEYCKIHEYKDIVSFKFQPRQGKFRMDPG